LPWEETEDYIRSGHENPEDFVKETFRTIVVDEGLGIKAVVAKAKKDGKWRIVSYLFSKRKGWTLEKAKRWFAENAEKQSRLREAPKILVFEKFNVEKPLRIRGIAVKAGMSRNRNFYLAEELKAAAQSLKGQPVYLEHVHAGRAIGRVVDAWYDEEKAAVLYEAEIYDEETIEKIKAGVIQHVSIGADY